MTDIQNISLYFTLIQYKAVLYFSKQARRECTKIQYKNTVQLYSECPLPQSCFNSCIAIQTTNGDTLI